MLTTTYFLFPEPWWKGWHYSDPQLPRCPGWRYRYAYWYGLVDEMIDIKNNKYTQTINRHHNLYLPDSTATDLLQKIQAIVESPLILSLASFSLVAILLILVGFCIVRQIRGIRWDTILPHQKTNTGYQEHRPKFMNQPESNVE